MHRLLLSFIAACLIAEPTCAAPRIASASYQAIVLAIHDGDTIPVLHGAHREKLRLAHCDSPELAVPGKWKDQPGGHEAAAALVTMIMGQPVTVIPTGKESWHRTVADIRFSNFDVCHEMAREGEAWIDPRFGDDLSLYAAQDDAVRHHRGLWAAPGEPVPPWLWREQSRK